jgi:nondiscriminating glutamyl-tRNA synthetase
MAPSPTGYLHLGHAKGYLINYALAKSVAATFILRVEDTDLKKNKPETVDSMIDDCKWLGIEYDFGPEKGKKNEYFQSERFDIYKKYVDQLLEEGKAYKAYETPEERQAQIAEQRKKGQSPVYNGAHANLTKEEQDKFESEGRKPVMRLKVPKDTIIKYHDQVYGDIETNTNNIGDLVIQKSDGTPMYVFAVVIDDQLMNVTDIVRGKQHLSSIPKQHLIYNTFGWQIPNFAHFSDLLNESSPGKLAKRHGAKAIAHYRAEGYLPEAIFNYLILASTSFHFQNKEDEIMTIEEIFKTISVDKILKTNAKFNAAKLDWFNGQHIRKLNEEELFDKVVTWLENDAKGILTFVPETDTSLVDDILANKELLRKTLPLIKERITKFSDILEYLKFFYKAPVKGLIDSTPTKHTEEEFEQVRSKLYNEVDALELPWNHEKWEATIRGIADEMGWKHGDMFMALRLLIVGSPFSPPLYESMVVLGKEECLDRLK